MTTTCLACGYTHDPAASGTLRYSLWCPPPGTTNPVMVVPFVNPITNQPPSHPPNRHERRAAAARKRKRG